CLILLDLNLPKISGHEVLRFIKTEPALKRIPVVILTSSSATDDVLACYERYANGYVVKPVTFTELKATVRTLENFWFSTAILPNHVLA
ncbi:MAG: response regulator, partial [Pseudomonadota bacterium]